MVFALRTAALLGTLLLSLPTEARTVYRCVRDGTVSLATAPEPGSKCKAIEIDDNAAKLPNLWGNLGKHSGVLYERWQDGRMVYSTRNLPGSIEVLKFTVQTPAAAQAHAGLGSMGPPRTDVQVAEFRAAAKSAGVDEAWLRAIAHVESGYDSKAESPKGAQGVMQLMPATATQYGVKDPFDAAQSISAGARHLRDLMKQYGGDLSLTAAAYNAGPGAVARYGGIPPYAETRDYVVRVLALHEQYRKALSAKTKKKSD
ncbi:lytic transglycosylase domain-containing protein [Arenimonas sp.]|uniref:lytic transglycosylase domain-containing protein n=1 Tax=Arenimonas sp. TaxID=1872635 RepID=UPI0039E51F88